MSDGNGVGSGMGRSTVASGSRLAGSIFGLTVVGGPAYKPVIDGLGCLRATLAGIDAISDFGLGVYAWQGLPGVLSSLGFGFVLSFAVLG